LQRWKEDRERWYKVQTTQIWIYSLLLHPYYTLLYPIIPLLYPHYTTIVKMKRRKREMITGTYDCIYNCLLSLLKLIYIQWLYVGTDISYISFDSFIYPHFANHGLHIMIILLIVSGRELIIQSVLTYVSYWHGTVDN
jgi:hypothetical protein